MKKSKPDSKSKDLPVFELNAFSKKATWSDFYIQDIKEHVAEHAFVERPHKHDFYLILFVEKGRGVHTIDFIPYPIQSDTIFLMTPGQVHSWKLSKDIKGSVIFFTRSFYERQLNDNSLLEFPFYHSLVASPVIKTPKSDALKFAVRKLREEYMVSDSPDLRMLRAWLDIFLLEAVRYYPMSNKTATHGNTFKLRKLEQLIETNFRKHKQPAAYAERMNLAAGYLNSICKESLGKTLTELIQQRVVLEAKRLFSYSDMNVNEVAAKLGFSETSYFIRWFKKQTQQTPDEFRRSLTNID